MRLILALALALSACGAADRVAAPPAPPLEGMWAGVTAAGVAVSLTLVCPTEHTCAGQGAWGRKAATVVATYEHPAVRMTVTVGRQLHQVEGEVIDAADQNVIMARVDGRELMLRR